MEFKILLSRTFYTTYMAMPHWNFHSTLLKGIKFNYENDLSIQRIDKKPIAKWMHPRSGKVINSINCKFPMLYLCVMILIVSK